MLTYIISGSNRYSIRTSPTSSNQFTMSLQNMTTQVNSTASLSGVTYNGYESILAFTASIAYPAIGEEYRIKLLNSGSNTPIWHGSLQMYMSQSQAPSDKADYLNQNDGYISNATTNEYVII